MRCRKHHNSSEAIADITSHAALRSLLPLVSQSNFTPQCRIRAGPHRTALSICLFASPIAGHYAQTQLNPVVKLLSKRWWIPTGARLEGPKLESEGPRAEVGLPTADQGFSSIQVTLFGFYGI